MLTNINEINELDSNDSLLTAYHMPRPRINKILEKATRCQLVYVIAGAGYGKTQAVRHYIERQANTIFRWVQLTENDNVGSRYWENLAHSISYDNPELAEKLRELGFPETAVRFRQFASTLRAAEHRSLKTFLVLDDFHTIHSEQALAFTERCAYLYIPGACMIVISRKEPEINVVSLFSKGQVAVVTEDELRFTDDEILEFLKRREIPFPAKSLPQLAETTQGWALAIQLLALTLKKSYSNLDFALDTMKSNIFKLMEAEAFDGFPEEIKKTMVKLSLVSNLPMAAIQKFVAETPFFQDVPELASFAWLDTLTGEYRVHPLYWEFLQGRQSMLTDDEIQDTYRRAADWCSENNFQLDAMHYLAKLRDFGQMVQKFLSFPFKLPHDTCEYFLGILENLGLENEGGDDIEVLLLRYLFMPLLLTGLGRYGEAEKLNFEVIREWEHSDLPASVNLIYTAYSNLIYINIHTCTATHEYHFAEYIQKATDHFKKSKLPPVKISGSFAVADVRSFICLVGEGADAAEIDHFQKTVNRAVACVTETDNFRYYGYDDLLACELAFFRNRIEDAKTHAHRAIFKAREKGQYNVEMMAAGYLLRFAVYEGDTSLAREVLKQMETHLDNHNFWNRQLLFDLFTGFFYAQIDLPRAESSRLFMDERESPGEVHIPSRELIVCVKNYISSKKYNQALVALYNSYPREPGERFLLGELTLWLLTAAVRIKTDDVPGAMKDFEKAYSLSLGGEFEMPFVELGRNLRPLVAAALKQGNCPIPAEWLKTIDRKASAYAKKAAFVAESFKREKNIKELTPLSGREQMVLKDMYHGLSRDEIAVNRYLSVNTVKKILQSIYIKLNANNNVDAIRIALEKHLIE